MKATDPSGDGQDRNKLWLFDVRNYNTLVRFDAQRFPRFEVLIAG